MALGHNELSYYNDKAFRPSDIKGLQVLLLKLFSHRDHSQLFRQKKFKNRRDYLSGKYLSMLLKTCYCVNPLRAKFFRGNIKDIFTFYVIPPHWYDTCGWNPSSNKTRTYPFYIVNIMAAGVLATQGARTSTAMILTELNRDNPARLRVKQNEGWTIWQTFCTWNISWFSNDF